MERLAKELYEKHGGDCTPYEQLTVENKRRWERVAVFVGDLLMRERDGGATFGNVPPNPG